MFKAIVGRGHPEFATNRQQDAQEFLLHLLNMIDRNERSTPGLVNPVDCLRFKVRPRDSIDNHCCCFKKGPSV
jgi:ubiquitin carboxyl-terminal hydrolase 5/13